MSSDGQNKMLDAWQTSSLYWGKYRTLIEQMFAPLTDALVEEARIGIGQNVLNHNETEIVIFDEETGTLQAKGNLIIMRNLRVVNQACLHAMTRARDLNKETTGKPVSVAKTAFPKAKQFPSHPFGKAF
jgi:hypothetical protein